ncbi:MAG: two-component sensor histidine kinase [Acidimicrobiales bacterium]|nr:two-component sensor histidine kinase [Acidimicrobiales bacterium]MXX42891.1 two-component sensor histidine kinase [Acidimicrobiales bacterium]MYB82683.1 two-component sensor histidine kinase [Acidimicrobiales bacterium]MYI08817.1 two-component sensor histidine kinase [Acidimicrobiales bacterium]MYI13801.1 two-component sensor histidine kinase [Acidimicrobiales bacterium]
MLIALVAVAAALAVALAAVLLLVRGRSSASERLGRVVHRFAGEGEAPRPGEARLDRNSLDDWITYLESVATTAAMTANLAERDRARWQLAMNELAVGVVLVDEDGAVCASNALADEMMSARDAMALVGAGVTQLLESAREGQARSRTVKLTGPPPQVIEISGHPVASDSHALGAVAVMADCTEGVRTDEVRRDFVANLSHELRTPVGAIALLSETLAGEDDAAVRTRLVDRIGAEADRVRHIIDDLLELSRVELEGSMRQEPVPVVPLLGEVAHQYSEHARTNDVSLLSPDVDEQLVLHADRGQLLRAVGNLVDNAIKYSDPGSEVRLSAAPSSREEQVWVDVVVADDGIGIPADETERVFERFYRVDKARARATGGTGLGLSIVRHVVMNHGGEVMLHTREGVGTTFTLRLPACQAST